MANRSIHREIEAAKEAVALNAIRACARWLGRAGHEALAHKLLAAMIEDESDALPR